MINQNMARRGLMGAASGGADLTKPFYTYEFNIATDQNYQDATGAATRTFATWTPGQAFLDKVASYNIPANVYPYNPDGKPRFLVSIRKKGTITPDETYTVFMRKDLVCFFTNANRNSPYWRAIWRLTSNGTYSFSGAFTASNDAMPEFTFSSGTMKFSGQISQNGVQMMQAGDYVVEFYDMTWTSLLGGS